MFVAIAAILALSSCQNLERILPKNTGTWTAVSGTVNVFEGGTAVTSDSTIAYGSGELVFQFNEDGSGTYTEDGEDTDFTWTYNAELEQLR